MSVFDKVKEPLSKLQALINEDHLLRLGMIKEIEKHPVIKEIRFIQKILYSEENRMDLLTCSIPVIGLVPIIEIKRKKTGKTSYYSEDHFVDPVFNSNLGIKGQHERVRVDQGMLVMKDLISVKKNIAKFISEGTIEIELDLDPASYSVKKVDQENLGFFISYLSNLMYEYKKLNFSVGFGSGSGEGSLNFSLERKEERERIDNKILGFEFPDLRKSWKGNYGYGSTIGMHEMDYVNFLGFSLDDLQRHNSTNSIDSYCETHGPQESPRYSKIDSRNSIEEYRECLNSIVDNWDKIDKGLKDFYDKKIKIFELIKSDWQKFHLILQTQETITKLKSR